MYSRATETVMMISILAFGVLYLIFLFYTPLNLSIRGNYGTHTFELIQHRFSKEDGYCDFDLLKDKTSVLTFREKCSSKKEMYDLYGNALAKYLEEHPEDALVKEDDVAKIEPSTPPYQLSQEDQRKVDEMGNHFSISPTGNHCVFLYLDNREQLPCEEASDVINRAYRQLIHEDLIFAYEDLAPEYAKKIDEIRREHTFNIRKNDNRCHLDIESNDKVISADIEQDCKDVDKTINKYYELMVVGKS